MTTPDSYQASGGPADPQSWNRYAYVQNDPVNANDPSGLRYNLVLGGMYGDDFRFGPAFSVGFWPFHDKEAWTTRYGLAATPSSPVAVPGMGGGGRPPAPPRTDPDTTALALDRLSSVIPELKSTRCGSVVSLDELLSAAQSMQFYDARPGSVYAGLTEDYVSGNGSSDTLRNEGTFGLDANTLVKDLGGGATKSLPVVVLFANWWPAKSGTVILHEVMHYAWNAGDLGLFRSLGVAGFRLKSSYGTGQITNWLDAGCPEENATKRPGGGSRRNLW